MPEMKEFVIRHYYCSICNETHEVKLNNSLSKAHSRFPFPYIFLHGDLRNILTTLYIDKNFEIRGADVYKLMDEDLFSKVQAVTITSTLMEEIERLREENIKLTEELKTLKKRIKEE